MVIRKETIRIKSSDQLIIPIGTTMQEDQQRQPALVSQPGRTITVHTSRCIFLSIDQSAPMVILLCLFVKQTNINCIGFGRDLPPPWFYYRGKEIMQDT